jgi:threonine aldolase
VTPIDLRSDTVTLPPPGMRQAMAAADLGDDVYREDPTVRALEERTAALLGKAAGLFVPSGTMGNLLAVMAHTRAGDEMICGYRAHVYTASGGGAARLAGVSTWPVPQPRACLSPDDVAAGIHPADDAHFPRSALVWLEQPSHGWVMPLDNVQSVVDVARRHGLVVHMDGARIFNAAVSLGVSPADIARPTDSVMVCISKGLAAPVGSLLVGSDGFIAAARRARKVVGGGMRQAGVLAAAGLYALDCMLERLVDDHRAAQRLAAGLASLGWSLDRDVVETNMFYAEPPPSLVVGNLIGSLAELGVQVSSPYAGRAVRLVTHYGIDDCDVDHALEAFATVSR